MPEFVINGERFAIGFEETTTHPGIFFPYLAVKNGTSWDIIRRRDPMWSDIQEDITPEKMADLIVSDFNQVIAERSGQPVSWIDRLKLIFDTRLAVEMHRLVLT